MYCISNTVFGALVQGSCQEGQELTIYLLLILLLLPGAVKARLCSTSEMFVLLSDSSTPSFLHNTWVTSSKRSREHKPRMRKVKYNCNKLPTYHWIIIHTFLTHLYLSFLQVAQGRLHRVFHFKI